MASNCKDCSVETTGLSIVATTPPNRNAVGELPIADFLVITWTEAETHGLARLLGLNKVKFNTLADNTFVPLLVAGIPKPADAAFHGFFFSTSVSGKSVVCFKCNYHPKVQAVETLKLIEKLVGTSTGRRCKHLITSGTGGGIWAKLDVGDVMVTAAARFGLTLPASKQALRFAGAANVKGAAATGGFSNWFDYVNAKLITSDDCVATGLHATGGRLTGSGKAKIYYQPDGSSPTMVVTNTHINNDHINEEKANLATYRTMGGVLDENDAFVAEACKTVGFSNWVSIRNISDLPWSPNANQYTEFQYCSSINGAFAVWAFIMGH